MCKTYDIIIVGARCAGSPTAMLLAQKGYRVLLVDKATFPSDTLSTHLVQPLGVEALLRWGLLDRLAETGCPPIDTYAFDFGPFTIAGMPGTKEAPIAYCPRRTVLDKLLVDAAAEAGAEVREGFTVEELSMEDGRVTGIKGRSKDGKAVTDRATIVIGADGRGSLVASAVGAERYNHKPPLLALYYSYWSELPMNGRFEIYMRPYRGFGAMPTHEGLTLVFGGWPISEHEVNRKDIETSYRGMIELAPHFAERLHGAKREAPVRGAILANFFRKPFGPGWVLIGDAGYHKDSITAQGISDAFRGAERCARALDETLSGARPFDEAMRDYQLDRDERARPIYDFTCQVAMLAPPSSQMQQLLGAIHGNQQAMDGYVQMYAGTISPEAFLAPENVGKLIAAAESR